MADIDKVALLAVQDERVLLCRKRHTTSRLILPGGCIEPGESLLDCLKRELTEELGPVRARDLVWIGRYEHRAANDDPAVVRTLSLDLYSGLLEGAPRPSAEIREVVWFGESDDWDELAPSLSQLIFPDLCQRGLVPWRGALASVARTPAVAP